ncbi:MAG: hypothetical protein IKI47_03550 [Prevotella sp.]|nr:hypothetical protein [Prevotella sp.]
MNKNKGFPFLRGGVRRGLLLLLMLLPLCGFAQTLTQYEYWFDDDFAGRRIASLSGKEKDLTVTIDTYFLETGLHRLSLRVKQSDGHYSAITTSSFIKLPTGETQWLEYWFDGNQENSKRIAGTKASDGNGYVFNSEVDLSGLPVGIHQLYYRAVSDDGLVSTAVSVSPFMKLVSGEAKWLEYWFDGDETNKKRIAGTAASDGNGYVFNSEVDISGLSVGNHQLFYRAVSDNGLVGTAVSVSPFLKLVTGEAKWLEYWFDGDRANKKRIAGTKASDGNGYVFNNELDVSGLDPGHHRLYYRAVSDNGLVSTSVSTSSVVVKLLAEQAQMASDAKISGYRISVDGKNVETRRFSNPQLYWDLDEPLDARRYTTGNHSVKVTFWNTAGSSVSVEQPFEVLAPVTPTITLTAEEKNGVVNFKFNSVPNDLEYGLIRVDANGAKHKVDGKKYSVYPTAMSASDNPPAGSYTYYVAMLYRDASGTREKVQSNEVAVNIAKPQTEVEAAQEYGYITGSIVCDKNTTWKGLTVEVSGDATESLKVKNGIFNLQKIPVGMTLTLAVEGDKVHDYETKTLTIKAGENNVTINGTLREEYYPSNLENDLALKSGTYLETIQKDVNGKKYHAVKFSVKNLSAQNKWKGIVRVKAYNKESSNFNKLFKRNIYIGETAEELELNGLGTADLEIVINELKLKEDSQFEFHLESDGHWEGFDEANEIKPIEPVGYINYPIKMTMAKMDLNAPSNWNDEAKENYTYLMLGLSSLVPGIDGTVGDLSPFYKDAVKAAKNLTGKNNDTDAINATLDWLAGSTPLQALNEPSLYNLSSSVVKTYRLIGNSNGHAPLVEKYMKDIYKITYDYASASLMIDNFVQIGKAINTKEPLDATLIAANMIYSLVYGGTSVPYANMMHAYMVVGQSFINKIREYGKILNGRFIGFRLKENKPYSSNDRQNTAVDFKLVVKTENGETIDFTQADMRRQIKSVSVKAGYVQKNASPAYFSHGPAEFSYEIVPMKDCIMLKTDGNGFTSGSIDDFNEINALYMTINWANNRQTIIPLNEETNGIDISTKGVQIEEEDSSKFKNKSPVVYTVTLKTATGKNNMADELYLGNNKKRK